MVSLFLILNFSWIWFIPPIVLLSGAASTGSVLSGSVVVVVSFCVRSSRDPRAQFENEGWPDSFDRARHGGEPDLDMLG